MSTMKKMSLVALAVCAVSTAAHAEEKSFGTATASLKVNAMQEWAIVKVKDGNLYIDKDGKASTIGSDVAFPEFKVVNNSATASKYYIAGAGASNTDNGDIMAVNNDDATLKIKVKPYDPITKKSFEWVSAANKYRSLAEVAEGESNNFKLAVANKNTIITPGNYTVSVELFAPTV